MSKTLDIGKKAIRDIAPKVQEYDLRMLWWLLTLIM